MRPDLSALDEQLDALSPGPAFDVLALAESYAGKLGPLPAIDDALHALEDGVPIARERVAEDAREPIELPEPMRAAPTSEEASVEHTPELDRQVSVDARRDVAPIARGSDPAMRESGEISVPHPPIPRPEDTRDITMEPIDEELLEAELGGLRSEPTPLANNALFDLRAPANVEAEQEADAAFAALFAEATRQSSMPTVSEGEPADDTEVFHTSELALESDALQGSVPYATAHEDDEIEIEPNFHDETLDSAEFEIMNDGDADALPANERPSRPPEKRPSFLGRLFGRKDE